MTPQEVAKEAIRRINKYGWFQMNHPLDPENTGSECLFLAVCHAIEGTGAVEYTESRDATIKALREVIGFPAVSSDDRFFEDLIAWNDAKGRTRAEVMEALRRVMVS